MSNGKSCHKFTFDRPTLLTESDRSDVGLVVEIKEWNEGSRNNAAEVLWPSSNKILYRLGYEGQVDLKYVQDAAGGTYYKDHLPFLDVTQRCEKSVAKYSKLTVGDLVKQHKPIASLTLTGETGSVNLVVYGENVSIQFGGMTLTFTSTAPTKAISSSTSEESSEITEKLTKATALGQKSVVQEILQASPQQANCKFGGKTALQIASHEGYTDIVELILSHNADPELQNDEGDTAVHCAAYGNRPEVLELLLTKGAETNVLNKKMLSPLYVAVSKQFRECAAVLLKHNCDVNIQDLDGNTPMHEAIKQNSIDLIRTLINVPSLSFTVQNNTGFDALHYAALLTDDELMMEILLNKAQQYINLQDEDNGNAPIHIAALNGNVCVIEVLISKDNCNVNLKNNNNMSPLMIAVTLGYCSMVEVLVQKGADVNAEGNDGNALLHLALIMFNKNKKPEQKEDYPSSIDTILEAFSHHEIQRNLFLAIACYLVQAKANLHYLNHEGKTPLDLLNNSREQKMLQQYDPNTISQPSSAEVRTISDSERVQLLEARIQEIEDSQSCAICFDSIRDVAFLCGHGTCNKCATQLRECPVCRKGIERKINLYG